MSETPRFEQLAPSAIEDPGLADEGARVLEWTRRNMPLLHRLRAEFARARPLDGRRIGMCLHVEAKTGVLGPTPSGSSATRSRRELTRRSAHRHVESPHQWRRGERSGRFAHASPRA